MSQGGSHVYSVFWASTLREVPLRPKTHFTRDLPTSSLPHAYSIVFASKILASTRSVGLGRSLELIEVVLYCYLLALLKAIACNYVLLCIYIFGPVIASFHSV